jgi:hypothetical protein
MPVGLETLAEAGVTAVIQPGGSRKDPEVIEAANRMDMAMVLDEVGRFKHLPFSTQGVDNFIDKNLLSSRPFFVFINIRMTYYSKIISVGGKIK